MQSRLLWPLVAGRVCLEYPLQCGVQFVDVERFNQHICYIIFRVHLRSFGQTLLGGSNDKRKSSNLRICMDSIEESPAAVITRRPIDNEEIWA